MRTLLFRVAVSTLFCLTLNPLAARAAPFAYVANASLNTVTVIDVATDLIVKTIAVGQAPIWMGISPDGTRALFCNFNDTTVSIINTTTQTLLTTISVGSLPSGVAFSPDSQRAYIALHFGGLVTIDTTTGAEIQQLVTTWPSRTNGIAINPAGTKIYVTNYGFAGTGNTITVVDVPSNSVSNVIGLPGSGPFQVAFDSFRPRAYVTQYGPTSGPFGTGTTIAVLDTIGESVLTTVDLGAPAASGISLTHDGTRAYVALLTANEIAIVDLNTLTVAGIIPSAGGPQVIAITSDDSRAYVEEISPEIAVIDLATNTEIHRIAVPGDASSLGNFMTPEAITSGGGCTLTALGPVDMWLGLKNSDDVGTKFDVLAEVSQNGTVIGSGQLNGVAGGSSGFNNAILRTVNMALPQCTGLNSGDTISLKLSARIAVGVTGHRSGTARLWFNDTVANSRVSLTVNSGTDIHYLVLMSPATLALKKNAPGAGPKSTIDVFVDRAVGGNPFKQFGSWSVTLP